MDKKITYGEYLQEALHFLDNTEITISDLRYLVMKVKRIDLTTFLALQNQVIDKDLKKILDQAIAKLQQHYPIQYVVGYEEFFGRDFQVTEDTLIPRPETEWIVEQILQNENNDKLKVVDLGTGSGVIGLTLKLERPDWRLTLTDISSKALQVAKQNAKNYQIDVDYCLGDNVLALPEQQFDIIISNPPYIAEAERDLMDKSVLLYEPTIALFAENNGYAFYEKLAANLSNYLTSEGRLYLEIGFRQGEQVKQILKQQFPQKTVNVYKDYNGNERLVIMK